MWRQICVSVDIISWWMFIECVYFVSLLWWKTTTFRILSNIMFAEYEEILLEWADESESSSERKIEGEEEDTTKESMELDMGNLSDERYTNRRLIFCIMCKPAVGLYYIRDICRFFCLRNRVKISFPNFHIFYSFL